MKAMILAAGRGERMRPLTDTTPKPLLQVNGKSLIEWHILKLKAAGVDTIVINTGWLGEQLPAQLGTGERFAVSLKYSMEGYPALETAGGIIKALPMFGKDPFVVVNSDVYSDFDFNTLSLQGDMLAHLVLVPNPEHNPDGDFSLNGEIVLQADSNQTFTFSGIAIYKPELFTGLSEGRRALKPVLDKAIDKGQISGEVYPGQWHDVGTVVRLNALNS